VRNSNPSLPLKHHRLRKCANTTMCISSCACVLAFSQYFLRCYISSLLDPNAYAQDDDLVALDSWANCIAPLDSRLSILNPVNHFSTHLRPAKVNPMIIPLPWSLRSMSTSTCLITMIIISWYLHHDRHFMFMHPLFVILWPPLLTTYVFITCVAYA
jgi:hypothetical protein